MLGNGGIEKRKARRIHVLNRLRTRFFDEHGNSIFSENDLAPIKEMITQKKGRYIKPGNKPGYEIHRIFYRGVQLMMVYDTIYKQLVTVLPSNTVR